MPRSSRPPRPPRPSATPVTNRIRERRFHAGEMTQQTLADRVGVSRQTIVAVEQGRHAPSLELAFRIARVFGVGVEEVFSFPQEGDPPPPPPPPQPGRRSPDAPQDPGADR